MSHFDDDSSDDDQGGRLSSSEASLDSNPQLTTSGNYVIPADDYEIDKKFEMGTIANMFYHPIGIFFYYLVVCLYLYGDLAIYAVAIPKSLVVVACTKPPNMSEPDALNATGKFEKDAGCFGDVLTQGHAYYIFLAIAAVLLSPWTFLNFTKSKYFQFATAIMRNLAFALMILIAIVKLAEGNKAHPEPALARIGGFPAMFGVSIYSFMCQHSLPGMITPMRSKKGLFPLMAVNFSLILFFYLLLAYTGAFRFPFSQLNDIYTLNFFTQFSKAIPVGDQVLAIIGYYLALFPVFTLSTNFPIISITLRENLKALARILTKSCRGDKPFPWPIDRLLFPLLALIPAIAIAFATQSVQLLVSITGSFPGVGVQYVIPTTLAFAGKYMITRKLGIREYQNRYKSPFSFTFFLVLVLLWTAISVGLIITEDVIKGIHHHFLD